MSGKFSLQLSSPSFVPASAPAGSGFPYEDADARLAPACASFLAGHLVECVRRCRAAMRLADASLRTDAAILWARCAIRLGRQREVLTILDQLDMRPDDPRTLVAAMLRGAALMRLGEIAQGTHELQRVVDTGLDNPVAVEAALEMARGDFEAYDFAKAAQRLSAAPVGCDTIGARVLEYRGFIAFYECRYDEAVELWRASLGVSESCGIIDHMVTANIAFALCIIATDRIDVQLWNFAQRWASRSSHLRRRNSNTAHQLHILSAAWHELHGRPIDALQSARSAESFASSPVARLIARCRRAAVLFHYGERLASAEACSAIRQEFARLDVANAPYGADEDVASEIAGTLAMLGDAEGAAEALARRVAPVKRITAPRFDSSEVATDYDVQSLVADAAGETLKARHLLERAFFAYRRLGLRRQALLAALRLLEMGPHRDASAYADEVTRRLPPESWARVAFVRLSRREPAAGVVQLNRAEREVLDMLLRGMSTAGIAKARGRSEGTTRNTVSAVLRAFNVPNRQALLAEYMKRTGGATVDGPAPDAHREPRPTETGADASDEAFAELRAQANDALWTHYALTSMLKRAIDTRASAQDVASLADPQACPIGAWLARDVSKAFPDSLLYEATIEAHDRFHREAALVLAEALAGDDGRARARMDRGGSFFDAAALIRSTLREWANLAQP